jgi:uncharacterized protein YegJ (DUF2314 family)
VKLFWKRKKTQQVEVPEEPIFKNVRNDDLEFKLAYAMAANSIDQFIEHIDRPGEHICAAKLRFRDPNLSLELGEDRFLFIWLNAVAHDVETNELSGSFFEVPNSLLEWHWPGQRLHFDRDGIFDWFVNDDGALHGGFTLRVTRSRLPADEQVSYDDYTGVKHWV